MHIFSHCCSAQSRGVCLVSATMHSIIKHAFHHQTCVPSSNMHSIIKHAFHHQTCISPQVEEREETEKNTMLELASKSDHIWLTCVFCYILSDMPTSSSIAFFFFSPSFSPDPKVKFGEQQDSSKQYAKVACDLCTTPCFGSQSWLQMYSAMAVMGAVMFVVSFITRDRLT